MTSTDGHPDRQDADGGGTELPPVVAQALKRASRADYARWEAMVHASGCCARPVRLAGRVRQADPDSGELHVVYTTAGEADQVLLKACQTRRSTRCPACAAIYRGDAKVLLRAGLDRYAGLPHDASGGSDAPVVFVTLTAPSFGAVHRAFEPAAVCRAVAKNASCSHGRPRACLQVHDRADPVLGAALCVDCYDWEAAVIFNALVGRLWQRTTIAVIRHLAASAGLPVRKVSRSWRLSFAKVVEFQARGVVHVHALARLDHIDDSPASLDERDLAGAFVAAAAKVAVPNPLDPARPIRWGTQADIQVIAPERRPIAAAYLAKYTTKSVDTDGLLDHRLRSVHHLHQLDLPEQLRRMVTVAWQLGAQPQLKDLNLRAWAHCAGYRGHWLTKSRHWSTTFGELRARRHAWRLGQLGIDPDDADQRIGEWEYKGVGHLTAGDAWLAASAASAHQLNRRTAWEET
jgi:hypothetical protein